MQSYGFQNCTGLQIASFPELGTVQPFAFSGCTKLVSLYLMRSSMTVLSNSNAFTSTPIGGYSDAAGRFGSIFVPASLYETYLANTAWKVFSSRFVSV